MGHNKNHNPDPQLISYITLRKAVGILGIAFPVALVIGSVACGGCDEIQQSISSYYHTVMRNIFVGVLCAIALFMFAYKGYDSRDAIAGNLACIFALGVAFLPTSVSPPATVCIPHSIDNGLIGTLHFVSAASLFLVFAYFSIFLFTISDKDKPGKMKRHRNRLYRWCGYIMIGCMLLVAAYKICINHKGCLGWQKYDPIFWLEAIMLWAFGISWLTKGKAILWDKEE